MPKAIAMPVDDRLMRIIDIQERCNVSRSKAYTILNDMQEKGFAHIKLGGAVRVRESVFGEYLASCEVG